LDNSGLLFVAEDDLADGHAASAARHARFVAWCRVECSPALQRERRVLALPPSWPL
jgi:hypothetical protein